VGTTVEEMTQNCDNCGAPFDDNYPEVLRTYLSLKESYPDCAISCPTRTVYCPACSEEIVRLQKLLKLQQVAATQWLMGEIKRFGNKRREEMKP